MTRRHLLVAGIAVAWATMVAACALTSRGESVRWQYFTPEHIQPRLEKATLGTGGGQVCLGRVTTGTGLGRRIAYGNGGHQVSYYEDRRWTEEPQHYVRRVLERSFLEENSLSCELEPAASSLDVEVLRFEEVKAKSVHGARVALRAVLTTETAVFDDTVEAVEPVRGSTFEDVVAAFGLALQEASDGIARRARAAAGKDAGGQPAR